MSVLFLFLMMNGICAQEKLNTTLVDRQTWAYARVGDWDGITALGKEALKQEIDFYYLRYRMGVAWYMKKNYHQAAHHFRKAWEQNPGDSLLQEYLYFSLVFSGREMEARHFASGMSSQERSRLGIPAGKLVEKTHVWADVGSSDDLQVMDVPNPQAPDGSRYISRSHTVFQIGLLHPVSRGLSIYHAYTHTQKDHFVYSLSDGDEFLDPDSRSVLNQYYLSGIWRLSDDFRLVTALHYIHVTLPEEEEVLPGIPGIPGGPPAATPGTTRGDLVGSIAFYGEMRYLTVGLSGNFSNLNEGRQRQGDLLLALYPLGNPSLYSASTLSFQQETAANGDQTERLVFFQRIGGRLTSWLWVEGSLSLGDMNNFVRYDGALVFNAMDMIRQHAGVKTTLTLSPRLAVYAGYTAIRHQSLYRPESFAGQPANPINFSSQTITGGIIWGL